MTHDPLCRLAKTDAPAGYVGVMIECDCYKVRYVRADERKQAAQRVAAVFDHLHDWGCGIRAERRVCDCAVGRAIAAARGDKS